MSNKIDCAISNQKNKQSTLCHTRTHAAGQPFLVDGVQSPYFHHPLLSSKFKFRPDMLPLSTERFVLHTYLWGTSASGGNSNKRRCFFSNANVTSALFSLNTTLISMTAFSAACSSSSMWFASFTHVCMALQLIFPVSLWYVRTTSSELRMSA